MPFYITDRLSARADMEERYLQLPGARESLAKKLARDVIREAEKAGGFPREGHFHFEESEGHNFSRRFTCTWSPSRARLVGGPNDGDEFDAVREGWQALPVWHTTGLPQQPTYNADTYATQPSAAFTYLLAGIDGMESVWVYEYRASTPA